MNQSRCCLVYGLVGQRSSTQRIDAVQKTSYPLNSAGLPRLWLFQRSHEHLIQPEAISPKLAHDGIRINHVAATLTHLFGNTYHTTFEGNIVYMPTDRIVLAYEFRQKADPYGTIASSDVASA